MPVRIYDISKKLGLENKEVLAAAKALPVDRVSCEWVSRDASFLDLFPWIASVGNERITPTGVGSLCLPRFPDRFGPCHATARKQRQYSNRTCKSQCTRAGSRRAKESVHDLWDLVAFFVAFKQID